MNNLNRLWEYQKKDIELDDFKAELKNTSTRKRLVQLQKFLKSSQKKLSDYETDILIKQDQLHTYESQFKDLYIELEELGKDLGYYTESEATDFSAQEVKELVKSGEALMNSSNQVKKNLQKLKTDLETADKDMKDILQKMRTVKKEYDALMDEHKKELDASAGEVEELEKTLLEAEQLIEPGLVREYKRIKGFKKDPVALLEDSRCTGCNMQLPSGVAASVINSQKPVLCENCGRILILL